jgi:hypothetical protein
MLRFCFAFVAFLALAVAVSTAFATSPSYQPYSSISVHEQSACVRSARMGPPKDYLLKMVKADHCKVIRSLNR